MCCDLGVPNFWLMVRGAKRGNLRYYRPESWQLDKSASIYRNEQATVKLWHINRYRYTHMYMYAQECGNSVRSWTLSIKQHRRQATVGAKDLQSSHLKFERARQTDTPDLSDRAREGEKEWESLWSSCSLYCSPVPSQSRKWRNRITSKYARPIIPLHTFPKASDKPA